MDGFAAGDLAGVAGGGFEVEVGLHPLLRRADTQLVLVPEALQGGEDRVGRGLPQAAATGRLHGAAQAGAFGRQIIEPQYLLNRWIVPLDRRVDYLTLRYGIKFEIPFEIVVVFSTNLNPDELADEAFLRRIQNKIYVEPVDSEIFDKIFHRAVADKGIHCENGCASYLRQLCQEMGQGQLRACYPRDILNILTCICSYERQDVEVNETSLKRAVSLYFTKVMTLTGDQCDNTEK